MRLPVVNGNDATSDEATTEEMVAYTIDHGINYFGWTFQNAKEKIELLNEHKEDKRPSACTGCKSCARERHCRGCSS